MMVVVPQKMLLGFRLDDMPFLKLATTWFTFLVKKEWSNEG